jgi:hypothetical protein
MFFEQRSDKERIRNRNRKNAMKTRFGSTDFRDRKFAGVVPESAVNRGQGELMGVSGT